jgi:5-formyltetrahydrofolate cyclo-ligase
MEMLKLYDFDDYLKLPLTKWNIKQPNADDFHRENPMMTGDIDATGFACLFNINDETFYLSLLAPLDLILMPGVAFSLNGSRMGHGMGYYDKYLHNYFNKFPDRAEINKTLLVGLGFREQIVGNDQLPLEPLDYPLNLIVTSD